MAYKLTCIEPTMGLNFRVRYENLSKFERPEVEARAPDGSIVKERTTFNGQVLAPGSTQRQWCDDAGNVYQKSQLKFFYQGQEVQENTQTKVFQVIGYQPEKNYTDNYVIATYYELFPDTNDMKKPYDQEVARITNLTSMKKLWDHLHQNQLVGRGEFSASSKGFSLGDAYLRAVEFGNKFSLELGCFREEKVFSHLQETVPQLPAASAGPIKRLKMV